MTDCEPDAGEVAAFRDAWVFAALAAEVRAPEQWLVHETPGRSLLVARDAEGRLAAFRNACTHRGTRLCRGAGQGRIRCPYHGWVFAPDGRLLGASRRAGLPDFDPADLALVRADLGRIGPFLFVHDRPQVAPPLAGSLGDIEAALVAVPSPVSRPRVRCRRLLVGWAQAVADRLAGLPAGDLVPGGHSLSDDALFVFPSLFVRSTGDDLVAVSVTPAPDGAGTLVIARSSSRSRWRRWRSGSWPPRSARRSQGAGRAAHFRARLAELGALACGTRGRS